VKVGRAAFDPEAIRLIEAHNPDVEFDWPRILKGEGAPSETRTRPDPQERRPRQERARGERQPGDEPRTAPSVPGPHALQPPSESSAEDETEREGVGPAENAPPAALPRPEEQAPDTPSGRRLGSEGLGRLRARYAEVTARIEEKLDDPAGQEELKVRAERLNPDAWVTDGEVTQGLEQYEAVYESLRAVVGRRRPRRSR
jgi:hypothetical protein